ncbi:hypothetical protein O4J56_26500 [Nocardiopsis sp. RSe5-2]|uniref:Uncharacterized protein n=1 Tax=Nocardiopsis endophytica TaxID=3018445 RepID=A0ABT4UD37_9ACTN|nr:hypothetical protein [Nocardiopsis endophytica]MDA2814227.1 hypothetical protein [Nocardiopsis endophytica]
MSWCGTGTTGTGAGAAGEYLARREWCGIPDLDGDPAEALLGRRAPGAGRAAESGGPAQRIRDRRRRRNAEEDRR